MINPHGMDPQTVLRFVKSVGAWPGRVIVIACEPADVEEMGWGLSEQVGRAPCERAGRARGRDGRRSCGARALAEQRDRQHGRQARRRPARVASSTCASASCARWCRTRWSSTSSSSRAGPSARAPGSSRSWSRRGCAASAARPSGRSTSRPSAARTCGGGEVRWRAANEFEVESIEVEEVQCIAPR